MPGVVRTTGASAAVEDGTESYFPEFKAATLNMIAAQGAIMGRHAPSTALLKACDRLTHGNLCVP